MSQVSDTSIIIWLGAPKPLRCDCGTENSVIAYLHPFLRSDSTSFRYGMSVSNQVFITHVM